MMTNKWRYLMDTELKREDIKVGHTYRAKRFMEYPFGGNNDRYILFIGRDTVQYDSDTVKDGRQYPQVPMERFLKWDKSEVING